MGQVTGVGGAQSVWVDGTTCHIKDLRPVVVSSSKSDSDASSNSERIIVLGLPLPG